MKCLFVTVGGSPAPIMTAIEHHAPDRTVFICSMDDPVSGRPGSHTQVTGEGKVCKSKFDVEKPDRPNIPTQLCMEPDSFEVLLVPADDPVTVASLVEEQLLRPIEDPTARILADYTGGTKSMSAGLFLAVVQQQQRVELFLVGGLRVDLVRVADGHQSVRQVDASPVQLRWRIAEAERAWDRHGYQEAADLLAATESPDPELQRWLIASRAFAAWDAFDHAHAYELLQPFMVAVDRRHVESLAQLKSEQMRHSNQPLKIWDLRLMSDRRAATGRHDVAVLVLYRAMEWIARWALAQIGIDADDAADRSDIADLTVRGHDDKPKLDLHGAWSALGRIAPESPLGKVARATEKSRLGFAGLRNGSLFAHGQTPLARGRFEEARDWLDQEVMATFLDVAFSGQSPYPQLPRTCP